MGIPEFKKKYTDEQLALIYAHPSVGGVLKELLKDVRHLDNLVLEAETAVRICKERFKETVNPLFIDQDFLYAFLSTWHREDSFHSKFSDSPDAVTYGTYPALCYAIHTHGKWSDMPTESWLRSAKKVNWDGVMPIEILHRSEEGFQSRMVAYRDSPIWDVLGFSGRLMAEGEPFPFESDQKVGRTLTGVRRVEIRRMYIRVGLQDPKDELTNRIRRFRMLHGERQKIGLSNSQRATVLSWVSERETEEDRKAYEPDPPSFDPPPPQRPPEKSYAYDGAKSAIDDAICVITKHQDSICEKTLASMMKMYSQIGYMSDVGAIGAGSAENVLRGLLACISSAVELHSKLLQAREEVYGKSKWWEGQKLPTEMDEWADFEEAMYQCSMEVSEIRGEASELFKSRKEIAERASAIVVPLGKLKTVRKTAVPDLLAKASGLMKENNVSGAVAVLKEASATGDVMAYAQLASAYSSNTSDETHKLLAEAYKLAAKQE